MSHFKKDFTRRIAKYLVDKNRENTAVLFFLTVYSFNLTRTKIPKNVWWKNSRKCIRWKRDNFRHFQTLCGNAEIVQWGDEQKQGWIIELSLLLVFFSSTAVVGYVKFQMDFYPPFFQGVNQHPAHTWLFSKEKRQKVKQGDCLRIPRTIALSTIQMKAFALLPSSGLPPFPSKKWDWNNFSIVVKLPKMFRILKFFDQKFVKFKSDLHCKARM